MEGRSFHNNRGSVSENMWYMRAFQFTVTEVYGNEAMTYRRDVHFTVTELSDS